MIYLTAQKVVSATGNSGVNTFRYKGADVRSLERLSAGDIGTLDAQRVEVPPGGNEVVCYLDVIAPDAMSSPVIGRALESLRRSWSPEQHSSVGEGDVQAAFTPGNLPSDSARTELDSLIDHLMAIAQADPAPLPRETRPITILVSVVSDGRRYALQEDSEQRLRALHGPEWRPMSVTLGDPAPTAVPIIGELNASLVVPLTGLDVLRLYDEFGGVRLVQMPGGAVLWEWPLHDGRPDGYCLSCHQRGTLRAVGSDAFVCAYCGNLQSTDGLWVAALS